MRTSLSWMLLLTLAGALTLGGCGDDNDDDDSGPEPTATSATAATPTRTRTVAAAATATATGTPRATATPASGTTLTGVAATGAPIVGDVCVVDGNGTELACVDIANDGTFSVSTQGSEGPYLLAAIPNGGGQRQYSWSDVADGVVNITPFTTLSLLLATDYADLDALFEDWREAQAEVDPDTLADAVDAVLENFAGRLANQVPSDFDPFRSLFAANGTGFDGVLDGLDFVFNFDAGTVTLDGQGLVIDFDPGTVPNGNFKLTLSVSVSNGPSQQVAVLNNVPKPDSRDQFCSPEIYNDYFSTIGNFTITSCTFDGNVGRIAANVSVSGFNIAYAATYTYSPM